MKESEIIMNNFTQNIHYYLQSHLFVIVLHSWILFPNKLVQETAKKNI